MFRNTPGADALASLSGTRHSVFWLDRAERPAPAAALVGAERADLLVVGAGFTGLWTALLAKQADPGRDIVLVEGGRAADGATGRNGGFVAASLTHGFANGMERWPAEMPSLLRMGHDNLDAIESAVGDLGIDCDFVRTGELDVALEPYQVDGLREHAAEATALGRTCRSSRPRRFGRGSTRRSTSVPATTPTASPSSIPRDWPGGCVGHASRPASGCSSARRSTRSPVATATSWPRHGAASSGPTGSPWPPTPTHRCCAGSSTTWCPCTTTCW